MMKTRLLQMALYVLSTVVLFCTNEPVSGPSTEQGNPQIVAVVLDKTRRPVAGAAVTPYLTAVTSDTLSPPLSATQMPYAVTDEKGRCEFSRLPHGTYSLTASDREGTRRAIRSGIALFSADSEPPVVDTLLLELPGSIGGTVVRSTPSPWQGTNNQLDNGAIMVIVQEIGLSTITPASGGYQFRELPPGNYTVMYYATNGFYTARRSVTVYPDSVIGVDTVSLKPLPSLQPPAGLTAEYDTAAAKVHLHWETVEYDSLRWYELERKDPFGPYDSVMIVIDDTTFTDDVQGIPAGTTLYYIIRSVDKAFNRSINAGPAEVTLE